MRMDPDSIGFGAVGGNRHFVRNLVKIIKIYFPPNLYIPVSSRQNTDVPAKTESNKMAGRKERERVC